MIISCIYGGLGNQMFQYAVGRAVALKTQQQLKLDISSFKNYTFRKYELGCFQIEEKFATPEEVSLLKYGNKLYRKMNKVFFKSKKQIKTYYKEKYYNFDSAVIRIKNSIYLFGYWQSEKYFIDFKSEILNDFSLKNPPTVETKEMKDIIDTKNSVSMHVRRGDYITSSVTNAYHGTCDLFYYQKAIEIIESRIQNIHYFIFSDDLEWVKKNMNFIKNKTFVELPKSTPDYEEMFLMSKCKHNIIANSSFSWWGAWLNQNKDKIVIAPNQWFRDISINTKDLIPSSWIRI